jgi:hypothetical protein
MKLNNTKQEKNAFIKQTLEPKCIWRKAIAHVKPP